MLCELDLTTWLNDYFGPDIWQDFWTALSPPHPPLPPPAPLPLRSPLTPGKDTWPVPKEAAPIATEVPVEYKAV